MKILHISTYDHNGAGIATMRLHKALLAQGIQSKVLCAVKKTDIDSVFEYRKNIFYSAYFFMVKLLYKLRIKINKPYCIRKELTRKLKSEDVFYTLPLTDYRIENHPLVLEADIIHLHWVGNFINYPTFFSSLKKPIIWTIHDENIYYGIFHHKKMQEKYYNDVSAIEDYCKKIKLEAIGKLNNITIVSLSTKMLELSKNQELTKNHKNIIIHNCVDSQLYYPVERAKARKYFQLPTDKIILTFVCIGINDPNKGINELIKAIEQLNNENIILLAIGGDKVNISTSINIHFLGYINNEKLMSLAYSASDLFILPSFQEAFAQTPLEAMSCGIPVVMFPCSGSNDLIREHNGIIAESFTVEALTNALIKVLDVKFDTEKIRKTILDSFTPQNIITQYTDLYNKTIEIQDEQNLH